MTTDLGRCCDVAAHCDTLSCGHGFTPVGASVFQPATNQLINSKKCLVIPVIPVISIKNIPMMLG